MACKDEEEAVGGVWDVDMETTAMRGKTGTSTRTRNTCHEVWRLTSSKTPTASEAATVELRGRSDPIFFQTH
jgi:hypothetical protein